MFRLVVLIILCSIAITVVAEYSLPVSILSSAVLPGAGQFYTHQYTKAGIFFASEVGIIFSYLRMRSERDWAIDSYKQYAYSKIDFDKSSSDNRYQVVQNYFSSEEYNDNVRNYARNAFLLFGSDTEAYYEYLDDYLIPEEDSWHWPSERNWQHYKSLRRDKQDYEIYMNFAIGAAIVNRIISTIDATLSTKKLNKVLSNLSVVPTNKELRLCYEYKF